MTLSSTTRALCTEYDIAMLDLDGVVYLGDDAVPGAAEALGGARTSGMRLAYITNNASRTATDVAAKLRGMGIPDVDDADVVTSAQAVARLVAEAVPAGSTVLVVGGPGLRGPLEERGLTCVSNLDGSPVAVVQGFHADVGWSDLAEASYAIQSGLPWFVSNTDMTVPTARGTAPGNGSLVQAVRNATGATPVVAGKPERALFDETIARVGGERPLMVGDRLDTDIDGAVNAGIDSLAVLTGVSTLQEIVDAPPGHRPSYVSMGLAGLGDVHETVQVRDGRADCGDASAVLADGTVTLVRGSAGTSAVRAVVALAWDAKDRADVRVHVGGTLDA